MPSCVESALGRSPPLKAGGTLNAAASSAASLPGTAVGGDPLCPVILRAVAGRPASTVADALLFPPPARLAGSKI